MHCFVKTCPSQPAICVVGPTRVAFLKRSGGMLWEVGERLYEWRLC